MKITILATAFLLTISSTFAKDYKFFGKWKVLLSDSHPIYQKCLNMAEKVYNNEIKLRETLSKVAEGKRKEVEDKQPIDKENFISSNLKECLEPFMQMRYTFYQSDDAKIHLLEEVMGMKVDSVVSIKSHLNNLQYTLLVNNEDMNIQRKILLTFDGEKMIICNEKPDGSGFDVDNCINLARVIEE